MRMLYVKKLYLWPRYVSRYFAVIARIIEMVLTSGREYRPRMCSFHQRVIESLQHHQPEVIELHQPLSPLMTGIQECITEIMQACLNELKGSNQVSRVSPLSLSLSHRHTLTLSDRMRIRWISQHSRSKEDSFETLST